MDFEGKVMEILPAVTGQSARGTWERQTVVFEQPNKQYGKEIAVTFMNKRAATTRVSGTQTCVHGVFSPCSQQLLLPQPTCPHSWRSLRHHTLQVLAWWTTSHFKSRS